jgi:thiol-disulfide isomerase/thioredoxin
MAGMTLLLLTTGCGQEEPDSGALYVSSTPDSARIVLDGANTGNITPHLLMDISPGNHNVEVQRDNYIAIPESLVVLVLPAVADSVHFELALQAGYGAIFVTSSPESALILLDGASTDAFTPDTLTGVPTGLHWVAVEREGYVASPESLQVLVQAGETTDAAFQLTAATGRPVLLESFTNTSCDPCAEANPMMYDLMDELGPQQAILMEFHTSFPSPLDPFYLAQPALMDDRVAHYGVSQAPWVIVEGVDGLQPLSRDVVSAAIETAEPSVAATLALEAELNGTALSCSLGISAEGAEGVYRVYVFVTHDRVEYEEPPGSNGETLFRHVVRQGLTATGGVEVDVTAEPVWLGWTTALEWREEGETVRVVAVASELDALQVSGLAARQLP